MITGIGGQTVMTGTMLNVNIVATRITARSGVLIDSLCLSKTGRWMKVCPSTITYKLYACICFIIVKERDY